MMRISDALQMQVGDGIKLDGDIDEEPTEATHAYGIHTGQTLMVMRVCTLGDVRQDPRLGIDRIANWFLLPWQTEDRPLGLTDDDVVLLAECEDGHLVAVLPVHATEI